MLTLIQMSRYVYGDIDVFFFTTIGLKFFTLFNNLISVVIIVLFGGEPSRHFIHFRNVFISQETRTDIQPSTMEPENSFANDDEQVLVSLAQLRQT